MSLVSHNSVYSKQLRFVLFKASVVLFNGVTLGNRLVFSLW